MYEKYLIEVVTPEIPKNATAIIHGHTDIIGEESYNLHLSLDRANEVKGIIEKVSDLFRNSEKTNSGNLPRL